MTLQVSSESVDPPMGCDPRAVPGLRVCQSDDVAFDKVTDWVTKSRDELSEELTQQGAVLFRNFPLRSPEDFDLFVRAFRYPNFRYDESLSNAVRVVRTERVFSANEAPPSVQIFLHHEMAQTPVFPGKLFFFCEVAAESGGATPLCRSDLLYESLKREEPQFIADCEQKGLRYSNVMPDDDDPTSGMGRSWRSTFRAIHRDEAERRMKDLGYSWEWQDDGSLRATTPVLPGVCDLGDGRKVFFNQLIAAACGWQDSRNDPSRAITFGDGTPLDRDAITRAVGLSEPFTFPLAWQHGEVALVDNLLMMHARQPFTGKRKVWASLVAVDDSARQRWASARLAVT